MTRPLRTSAADDTSHYERFPQSVTPEFITELAIRRDLTKKAVRELLNDAFATLAAKLPNDAELGAAVRALIGGER